MSHGAEGETWIEPTGAPAGKPLRGGVRSDSHYETGKVIGRGGMGEVISVFDRDLRRHVVMKTLHENANTDPSSRARFVAEARTTGQLSHPNIVPVHDFGVTHDGEPFFTMKHVEGEDLSVLIERLRDGDPRMARRYTVARRLEIFRAICNAVAFAHAQGVIHRDLKPANVRVGSFAEVLVMDWGLAKLAGESDVERIRRQHAAELPNLQQMADSGVSLDPMVTQDGAILGTPAYMPPEQAAGAIDAVDHRSDIYSLGAVLFELLALRPPYEGGTVWDVLGKVSTGERVAPGAAPGDPAVPRELVAIVDKAMELKPRKRYSSVEALIEDLTAFSDNRAIGAASYSAAQRLRLWLQRNRAAAIAGVLAIGALVAGVAISQGLQQRAAQEALAASRSEAWQTYETALAASREQQPGSDAWYRAQSGVVETARLLVRVDSRARARGELAEAARALARQLGADENIEMGRLLLDEAKQAGLSKEAYELEDWMLRTARQRRGRAAALKVRAALDAMETGASSHADALRAIVGAGAYPSCTQTLVRALFRGKTATRLLAIEALAEARDRTTETVITGELIPNQRKVKDQLMLAIDGPLIQPLADPLAELLARCGMDGAGKVRTLTPARALGLLLHTRSLRYSNASEEAGITWAALRAIAALDAADARALVCLWQWRQGPQTSGWQMARRVSHSLAREAPPQAVEPGFEAALQRALVAIAAGDGREGLRLIRAGRLQGALAEYLRSIALTQEGRHDAAAEAALRASEAAPASASVAWRGVLARQRGLTAARAGKPEVAASAFASAAEAGDAYGLTQVALSLAKAGDRKGAHAKINEALRKDSRCRAAHKARAMLQHGAGDFAGAVGTCRGLVAGHPTEVEGRVLLADALQQLDELEASREVCNEILALEPGNSRAKLLRGLSYFNRSASRFGRVYPEQAVSDLQQAFAALPEETQVGMALVRALVSQKRFDEALDLGKTLESRGAMRSAQALRSWVLWHAGRHREAFQLASQALQGARGNEPHLLTALLTRAAVYRGARQYREMQADLERARPLANPIERARLDLELGRAMAMVGNLAEAVKAALRAIEQGGDAWGERRLARTHLARWAAGLASQQLQSGDRAGAIKTLRTALREGSPEDGPQMRWMAKQLAALER